MNIFVLSRDPREAARFHCDKHIVKMPLETAQMLSTICGGPYKPTHQKHPCTLWAQHTSSNYSWLVELGFELCMEYTFRYRKIHRCEAIIQQLRFPPATVPFGAMTPFAQAIPLECQRPDAVEAYRTYYREHKRHLAQWKYREVPPFMEECYEHA